MRRTLQGPGQRLTPKTGRPSKALKGLAVHDCTYKGCGKTYTRKEHLLRHERTHRNELPYVCVECNQGYARQDLLKRHTALKHAFSAMVTNQLARVVNQRPPPGSPPDPNVALAQQGYRQVDNRQTLLPRTQTASLPMGQSVPDAIGHQSYRPFEQNGDTLSQRANGEAPAIQRPDTNQQKYRPASQHAQQFSRHVSTTPTRQSSTTTREFTGFSQMQISPTRANNRARTGDSQVKAPVKEQLPVPWGAPVSESKQEVNINVLREAAYGDLAAIRRLHLLGVDVLTSGQFHNGGPKSGLFAAAESLKICFEDMQRTCPQPGPAQDRIWRDVNAKVEVIKYLTYHGADLNSLHPIYGEHVQRALRGQPPPLPGQPTEQQTNGPGGYRLIAAANTFTTLPPIIKIPEPQEQSLGTDALKIIQLGPEDLQGKWSSRRQES